MGRLRVQPHDAERLAAGFIDGDKRHRTGVIENRQLGEELR